MATAKDDGLEHEFDTQYFSLLVGDGPNDQRPTLRQNPHADRRFFPQRTILVTSAARFPYNYGLFCSAQRAIRELCSGALAPQFFALIEDDTRPVRCYFDFDAPPAELYDPACTQEQFVIDCANTVVYFCLYVDALLMRPTCYFYDPRRWSFYSACTRAKFSVHAHSDLVFANVTQLRTIVQRFVQLMECLRQHDNFEGARRMFMRNGKSVLDQKVYTPRPFRLPLNRKTQQSNNYLWPVALHGQAQPGDDDRPAMAQHLANGFIHPDPSIHTGLRLPLEHNTLSLDLISIRRRQLAAIAAFEQAHPWPLANMAQLETLIAQLIALSVPALCDKQAAGVTQQFHDKGTMSCRRECERVFLAPHGSLRSPAGQRGRQGDEQQEQSAAAQASEASRERRQWLLALCACVAVLRPTDAIEFEQRMPFLLQAAYDFSVGNRTWGGRQHQFLRIHGLRFHNDDYDRDDDDSGNNDGGDCDFFVEHAFCAFYVRARHYQEHFAHDGKRERLTTFLAIGCDDDDENDDDDKKQYIDRRVTGKIVRWRREFNWFRTLPAELFSTPEQVVTLDRLQQLCDVDPLRSHGRGELQPAPALPVAATSGAVQSFETYIFL